MLNQRLANHPLTIIRDNYTLRSIEKLLKPLPDIFPFLFVEIFNQFTICTDNLLVSGNDSGFNGSRPISRSIDTLRTAALLFQK